MSTALALSLSTDESFDRDVAPGTGLVALEFTAAWCPPCRVFGPIVEEAARAYGSRLRVLVMDTDASPATMVRLGVRSLPTLVVFRDGVEVERIIGAVPMGRLREKLDVLVER